MTQGGFSVDTKAIDQQAQHVLRRSGDMSTVAGNLAGVTISPDALGAVGRTTAALVQQVLSRAQEAVSMASASLRSQGEALTQNADNYSETEGGNAQRFTSAQPRVPAAPMQPMMTAQGTPPTADTPQLHTPIGAPAQAEPLRPMMTMGGAGVPVVGVQTHGPVDLGEPALQPQRVLNTGGQSQASSELRRATPDPALLDQQEANTWS
jgi:hypothetical protein